MFGQGRETSAPWGRTTSVDKLINIRTATNCPFSTQSDVIPPIWAGRYDQISDWEDILRPRRVNGLPERGRTILGEAGLGKSTLAARISGDAEGRGDWVTGQLRIPSKADPLKLLARSLLDIASKAGLTSKANSRIGELLGRVESVSVHGYGLSVRQAEGPEPFAALTDVLIELGEAAIRRGDVALVIHLDEVQNISDAHVLSQLLIALGDAMAKEVEVEAPGGVRVQRFLPIAVYLTGLPDFWDMTSARKGATFGRRFKTTVLEPLTDEDLAAALQTFVIDGWPVHVEGDPNAVVTMEPGARDAILELCCGEPFLFQLAGEQAWYAGTSQLITREQVFAGWEKAKDEATGHVERVLGRLPARERQMVEAMVDLDPAQRSLTNISDRMGFYNSTQAGTTAQRLDTVRKVIRRGKNYTFRNRALEKYLLDEWPDVEDSA